MPFDDTGLRRFMPSRPVNHTVNRPVALWLFVICFMLLVMIALGGATRLTGSGLSIMEWAPIRGILPPLTEAEWQRMYGLYQQIPQFTLKNGGMDLAGFKHIFWLEWIHRLWGRLMGGVFLFPLIWFAWRGQISRALLSRLGGIFLLGGLQGFVGWFMVSSGFFPNSTAVSPYRLVVHLALALVVYSAIFWTALGLATPDPDALVAPRAAASRVLRRVSGGLCALVALTILAGGFVAGTHAGFTYNTFPLMDGQWVPQDYAAQPFPRGWFENISTVQFDHRALATLTVLVGLCVAFMGMRSPLAVVRRRALWLGGAVLAQYALGVSTLLLVVPVGLATAHQALAVVVLSTALALCHALRGRS